MKTELKTTVDIIDIVFIASTTFWLLYYSASLDTLNEFAISMCFLLIEAIVLIIICNNMKMKLIRIIDVILIIITTLYLLYLNSDVSTGLDESFGLDAFDDLGKVVLCIFLLGLYILILIVTSIIMAHKQSHEE